MTRDDETFRRVLAGLQKGKAPTQAEREEAKRRLAQGQAQSKAQKARDERVKKLRNKKRGHGDDNVIDTGRFGSELHIGTRIGASLQGAPSVCPCEGPV
jgi:hypothetical protein